MASSESPRPSQRADEEAVITAAEEDALPVRGDECLIGDDARVCASHPRRHLACGEVVARDVCHPRDAAIHHRYVEVLTCAVACACL